MISLDKHHFTHLFIFNFKISVLSWKHVIIHQCCFSFSINVIKSFHWTNHICLFSITFKISMHSWHVIIFMLISLTSANNVIVWNEHPQRQSYTYLGKKITPAPDQSILISIITWSMTKRQSNWKILFP